MSNEIPKRKLEAFLMDLGGLAAQHGLIIAGCGCCGSPFLMPKSADGHYRCDDSGDSIQWIESASDIPVVGPLV